MSGLCGRRPLTMIGGGKEPFQLRGSAVADTNMGGLGEDQLAREKIVLCKVMGSQAG